MRDDQKLLLAKNRKVSLEKIFHTTLYPSCIQWDSCTVWLSLTWYNLLLWLS